MYHVSLTIIIHNHHSPITTHQSSTINHQPSFVIHPSSSFIIATIIATIINSILDSVSSGCAASYQSAEATASWSNQSVANVCAILRAMRPSQRYHLLIASASGSDSVQSLRMLGCLHHTDSLVFFLQTRLDSWPTFGGKLRRSFLAASMTGSTRVCKSPANYARREKCSSMVPLVDADNCAGCRWLDAVQTTSFTSIP